MNKNDQASYIKYLEERLAKITENTTIGNQDIDILVDTQNEVIINNASNLKKMLSNGNNYAKQITLLENRILASNAFIEYLTNSFWWKITIPFRLVSRKLANRKTYHPFDFSENVNVEETTRVIIYVNNLSGSLEKQVANLQKQTGFNSLDILLFDLSGSKKINDFAERNNLLYLNAKIFNKDLDIINFLMDKKIKYVVYLEQGFYPKSHDWLYHLVRPIEANYTNITILYENTKDIKEIKHNTYFNELKSRIISIDQYECLFLPLSRDRIQFIPYTVTSKASAVAKAHN